MLSLKLRCSSQKEESIALTVPASQCTKRPQCFKTKRLPQVDLVSLQMYTGEEDIGQSQPCVLASSPEESFRVLKTSHKCMASTKADSEALTGHGKKCPHQPVEHPQEIASYHT